MQNKTNTNQQYTVLIYHDTHCNRDVIIISGRSENNINASCVTISGERTKQLDIFCRVTGFLSFIVVELILFFHGAIQFCLLYLQVITVK